MEMSTKVKPKPCKNYKERAEALQKMANILKEVKKNKNKKFDLKAWAKLIKEDNFWATSCCIGGYAGFDKYFNDRGLVIIKDDLNNTIVKCNEMNNNSDLYVTYFDKKIGFDALGKFFSFNKKISNSLIYFIFDPSSYKEVTDIDQAITRLEKISELCLSSHPLKRLISFTFSL